MMLQVKMYYNLIKRWRSFNKVILVVNKTDDHGETDDILPTTQPRTTTQPPVFVV